MNGDITLAALPQCQRASKVISLFVIFGVFDVPYHHYKLQINYSFYRATLCISAIFAVARCLSVCPSVMLVYCIQMAEDVVKLLSHPGSPVILVF